MSRIVTEMECAQCGEKWEGYLSFGHPEQSFEFNWHCEECEAKNTYLVEEWISSKGPQNDVRIYRNGDDMVKIFLDMFHQQQFFDVDDFDWRECEGRQIEECDNAYLLLSDISSQFLEHCGGKLPGTIFVWVESALYGAIYQYGNYSDGNWHLHGKTVGYA